MGMDVNGLRYKAERKALHKKDIIDYDKLREIDRRPGGYFRNNWWWWRPLWDYCVNLRPDLIPDRGIGDCNNGEGLGDGASKELSRALMHEIKCGRTAKYEKAYTNRLDDLPNNVCKYCNGTGKRTDVEVQDGCNGCRGSGKTRPTSTWYPFSVENVREFAEFLAECEGFECH